MAELDSTGMDASMADEVQDKSADALLRLPSDGPAPKVISQLLRATIQVRET
jgi:hypothetical protein